VDERVTHEELRAKLRDGKNPVEGTGSALEATANEAAPPTALTDDERAAAVTKLQEVQTKLAALQGESPLILPTVDYQAVASVVGDWTGIPVGRMARNEIETVLKLPTLLAQRVIGQDHAMEMIAKRIQTSRAGLDNPQKPIGVFMLAGTSGVGKTETAIALAEALYGGEQNLIVINMSEYQEAHTVSSLKGAPPGYVGYGEGGVLTEAVLMPRTQAGQPSSLAVSAFCHRLLLPLGRVRLAFDFDLDDIEATRNPMKAASAFLVCAPFESATATGVLGVPAVRPSEYRIQVRVRGRGSIAALDEVAHQYGIVGSLELDNADWNEATIDALLGNIDAQAHDAANRSRLRDIRMERSENEFDAYGSCL
jgi:DNA polymerase III delta prime subunit